MKCVACGKKAPPDCQLCKDCLAEVKLMKYGPNKPATFQDAIEKLREHHDAVAKYGPHLACDFCLLGIVVSGKCTNCDGQDEVDKAIAQTEALARSYATEWGEQ